MIKDCGEYDTCEYNCRVLYLVVNTLAYYACTESEYHVYTQKLSTIRGFAVMYLSRGKNAMHKYLK